LVLGERRSAEPHLATALMLVRERGYGHFLRMRAREAPAPLIAALALGIEVDSCAAALVEAGARGESALLEVAENSPAARAQRAFHVLILLALRPRGASREELLETFWPGRQLAAGRRNFHPTLSYIRSVLPRHAAPPLLRDAEVYRLNPEYPLACDLWEFEA